MFSIICTSSHSHICTLIMAFLALQSADIFHGHAIHFVILDIVMELFVNAVEFVTGAVRVIEIDLGLAVTVHAPTHAQFRHLLHFVHRGDLTVAGLALYLSGTDML